METKGAENVYYEHKPNNNNCCKTIHLPLLTGIYFYKFIQILININN